jgi:hypothetical protein
LFEGFIKKGAQKRRPQVIYTDTGFLNAVAESKMGLILINPVSRK